MGRHSLSKYQTGENNKSHLIKNANKCKGQNKGIADRKHTACTTDCVKLHWILREASIKNNNNNNNIIKIKSWKDGLRTKFSCTRSWTPHKNTGAPEGFVQLATCIFA